MSDGGKSNGASIRVGNISNSSGIAIGHGSQASVGQPSSAEQNEISKLLADFILSLEQYRDLLKDAGDVRETAIGARAEVARPSPQWRSVRSALTAIAASVAAVATLSDAVNNIQALVERIIG